MDGSNNDRTSTAQLGGSGNKKLKMSHSIEHQSNRNIIDLTCNVVQECFLQIDHPKNNFVAENSQNNIKIGEKKVKNNVSKKKLIFKAMLTDVFLNLTVLKI